MSEESAPDPLAIQQPCRRYGLDEAIHPVQIAAFRRMSTGQKLDAISQMYRMGRWMLAVQIRTRHPDWEAEAVECEVSRRFANGTS